MSEDLDKPPSVRIARREDVDAIALIEGLSFFSVDEIFAPQQILRLIRNPNVTTLVAEYEGRVLGWAAALRRKTLRGITGRLYSIAVHPDARGKSLGEMLTRDVIDRLRSDRCTRLYLEVRKTNEPAIRLYHRLGFTLARTLPDYYSPGVDAFSMRLDMPEPGSVPVVTARRAS